MRMRWIAIHYHPLDPFINITLPAKGTRRAGSGGPWADACRVQRRVAFRAPAGKGTACETVPEPDISRIAAILRFGALFAEIV